ncbi:DUF2509 family protein [Acerihabitans sp. KWT182]|uniref:DUF2509 family protein n=1 Tax=Acerihabitans sp. KWT182 TaxID=3157919 RepID=A0AAU7Q7H3_9GAMM
MMPTCEQGSGALAVLPMLLVIGLSAMLGWQRFLDAATLLIHDEQRYLEAFHGAESALAWGMTVPWRGEDGECRRPEGETFRACLCAPRHSEGNWVLKGESGAPGDAFASGEISLYRRVSLGGTGGVAQAGLQQSRMLAPLAGGWLDYYPG